MALKKRQMYFRCLVALWQQETKKHMASQIPAELTREQFFQNMHLINEGSGWKYRNVKQLSTLCKMDLPLCNHGTNQYPDYDLTMHAELLQSCVQKEIFW